MTTSYSVVFEIYVNLALCCVIIPVSSGNQSTVVNLVTRLHHTGISGMSSWILIEEQSVRSPITFTFLFYS